MHIQGSCHCGNVAYKADVDPATCFICHCSDCQKLTGSPFRISVITSIDKIEMTGDQPKTYLKIAESGRPRRMMFCPNCGSEVFTSGEGDAASVWLIRWGSIDQRNDIKPVRAVFCRSAVDWIGEVPDLPGTEML